MNPDGSQSRDGLEGLSIDAAVEAVLDRTEAADPETVRNALRNVASDGVLSREAAAAAQEHLAETLFTPESRAELAGMDVSSARERAEAVSDVDAVRTRLAALDARADDVKQRADELGPALQDLLDRDPETADLYDLARAVQSLTEAGNAVHRDADQLRFDVDEFESWLDSPSRRHDEFEGDVDLVAESLADLEAAADAVVDADDPAAEWADATMRTRVLDLLVRDLAAELDDLHTLADEETTVPAELDEQVGDLDERTDALADRLAAVGKPGYRERFGDDLDALAERLADVETPVDWAGVQAALEEHRTAAFGELGDD